MLRITGLIRIANTVRAELGKGVSLQGKARLVQLVSRTVEQVGQMLNQHGMQLRQLPAPSRAAIAYLTSIQWDQVKEAACEPPQETVRWSWNGLGTLLTRVTRRLALRIQENELAEIGQTIQTMSRRMESTISREDLGPEQLSATTRELRGWFAWMSESENLAAYREAVERARASMNQAQSANYEIAFRPMRHIYKLRRFSNRVEVMLPTPMVRLDEAGFADLAGLIIGREPRQRIVERMADEAYVDLMIELESLGGVVEQTRGAFHDLAESFDRVNTQYFGGTMARPRLSWSAGMTRRKFGHYDHIRNAVMVSSTLDQSRVPQFVVDYLMFHELLHKKHGLRWHNGRGYSHTAGFYTEERTFERYQEADAWLGKLARGE